MRRFLLFPILVFASCAACGGLGPYPPPAQLEPLAIPDGRSLSYFVLMSDPNAGQYIVRDISATTEGGSYRWAYAHPALHFRLPPAARARFLMEFALPESNLRVTGPVSLSYKVNGRLIGQAQYDTPGLHTYSSGEIPAGVLKPDALNLVEIEPDKSLFASGDRQRRSFVLVRAGFTE